MNGGTSVPGTECQVPSTPHGTGAAICAVLAALLLTASCAGAPAANVPQPVLPGPDLLPQTRAERSGFTETSRYADVVQFLDSLRALGAPVHLDTLGFTTEGRAIPLVIASRPRVVSPAEARRMGRPIVYVQGNIHAGEVEGKEALQMLLRDLSFAPRPNVLDSVVLLAVPIYNADGNERWGPQARNRDEQNGPALVGERANAQGLDLNRDYIKAEAPETRAALALLNRWDPDVFVDLHTTNGSYHGYALTYGPSLTPAAGASGVFTRDVLLPELRQRMRQRHALETFDYGNFARRYGADVNTDSTREGWFTYDHRPRFGTNYLGLRGRVAILSEAFAHDPFARRVESTRAFVREILSLAAERAEDLRALRLADPATALPAGVPVRAELTRTPLEAELLAEILETDRDSVPDEPGVHRGIRRTGRFRTLRLPVYDRFDPVLHRPLPTAYLLPPEDTAAVRLLRLHGLRVERLTEPRRVQAEAFRIDSVLREPRPFQGHLETRLAGRWTVAERTAPAGAWLVPAAQPLGVLAAYLLEPQSADGLATWSVPAPGARAAQPIFAIPFRAGTEFPVLRIR